MGQRTEWTVKSEVLTEDRRSGGRRTEIAKRGGVRRRRGMWSIVGQA